MESVRDGIALNSRDIDVSLRGDSSQQDNIAVLDDDFDI